MRLFKQKKHKTAKPSKAPKSSPKRKLRIKKPVLYGLGGLLYLLIVLNFVSGKSEEKRCSEIKIQITDSSSQLFITPKDINQLLKNYQFAISGYPLDEINDLMIEDSIGKHPSVEGVEVYKSPKGWLGIEVKQRQPIVRVLDASGDSYYIDNKGTLMPLSKNYTARVPVITGQFRRAYQDYAHADLNQKQSDTLLYDLYHLAKEIKNHPYWFAQCDQITVNEKQDIILIPKMGANEIVLGQNRNFVKDLEVLTAFYQQTLPHVGWEKYKRINLKYNQQIVCVK